VPGEPADLQAELERTRKALADANKEAAQRRKKLEAYEAAEAQRRTAAMTELEQAQAKVAELEKRATEAEAGKRQALIRAAVIARATAKGFREPEDVLRFLDTTAVEIADDGQVKDVDKLLTDLSTSKPYLLQPTGTVGATNPGRGQQSGDSDEQRRQRLFGGGGHDLGPGAGYVPLREG
jgi:multidrug efflux pump subunit AcrA (membrane-fusion protein)